MLGVKNVLNKYIHLRCKIEKQNIASKSMIITFEMQMERFFYKNKIIYFKKKHKSINNLLTIEKLNW